MRKTYFVENSTFILDCWTNASTICCFVAASGSVIDTLGDAATGASGVGGGAIGIAVLNEFYK